MNLDFDYIAYLNEIAASGLNVTRTFSGAYVEPADAFGIKKNTMAPGSGKIHLSMVQKRNRVMPTEEINSTFQNGMRHILQD